MTKKKSDLSRAFSEDGALKTHVGGQALLEGIMMRGKYNWSVAVREPDGTIYLEEHDLASGKTKNGWMHWPIVRGCRALVESLLLGFKALEIASLHAFGAEESGSSDAAESEGTKKTNEGIGGAAEANTGASDREPLEESEKANSGIERDIREVEQEIEELDAEVLSDYTVAALKHEARKEYEAHGDINENFGGETLDDQAKRDLCEKQIRGDSCLMGNAYDANEAPCNVSAQGEVSTDDVDRAFSWKDDFGNPEEMIDALGAQRSLTPVEDGSQRSSAPTGDVEMAASREDVLEGASEGEGEDSFGKGAMMVSLVLGLVLGIALFIIVPAFITNLIVGEYDRNTVLWNIVDGLLRVGVFVFYIWAIGRMSDIRRMFMYHGAEHKTIHCYEHGLELTPENARSFPRLHVRCGTAFLIMVMIIAIFVYTIFPVNAIITAFGVPDGIPKLVLVIAIRILLIPIIAGLSYEITVKWAGSHPDNPLVKLILWPGMQMQYLTTNEPDDKQLECAIHAMKLVLEREEREAAASAS